MLQTDLGSISDTVADLEDTEDDFECTLEEYRDRTSDIKAELAKLKTSLLSSEAAPGDTVMTDLSRIEKLAFDCLLAIKKRLRSINSSSRSVDHVDEASQTRAAKFPWRHTTMEKLLEAVLCVSARSSNHLKGRKAAKRHQGQDGNELDSWPHEVE